MQIIQNDVNAHQSHIEDVNDAGRRLIASEGGATAAQVRDGLDTMNNRWEEVLTRLRDRQLQLDDSLREAKSFHDDLHDMLQRLSELDSHLFVTRPVGGLPETAQDQLDKFLVSFWLRYNL